MDFLKNMKNVIDKGVSASKDVLGKAKDRAQEMGEMGVTKFEIMQLEQKAHKLFASLGSEVYEKLIKDGQQTVSKKTAGISEILDDIAEIERQLEEKQDALKK